MSDKVTLQALKNVPLVSPDDHLGKVVIDALANNQLILKTGDIVVIAQKIVSKSHNLYIDLGKIVPGKVASELAVEVDKDPRLVEVILSQSRSVVRKAKNLLITEHKSGWIMANSGLDSSNVEGADEGMVLLLPDDPDSICEELKQLLQRRFDVEVGILINDSFGRPWRNGTVGVALGAAGIPSLWDLRGEADLFGRELAVSQQAIGDELAAAASLLQGQGSEGQPIVVISGLRPGLDTPPLNRSAADLIRPKEQDLFR